MGSKTTENTGRSDRARSSHTPRRVHAPQMAPVLVRRAQASVAQEGPLSHRPQWRFSQPARLRVGLWRADSCGQDLGKFLPDEGSMLRGTVTEASLLTHAPGSASGHCVQPHIGLASAAGRRPARYYAGAYYRA
jgi:hypothetical protein